MSPLKTEAERTPHAQCRDACSEPHRWFNTGDGLGGLKYWCEGPQSIHQPLLTMDEYATIKADVYDSPWTDPQRFPECLGVAMDALRTIACVTVSTPPEVTATQALRRIVQRSVSGVPFGEPAEPAWSLDPEERDIPKDDGR